MSTGVCTVPPTDEQYREEEAQEPVQTGQRPAAVLDVDGTLYQGDVPLGVDFSTYVFQETMRGDYEGSFNPAALKGMNDALEAYKEGEQDYVNASREVVNHWMDGVQNLQQDTVEQLAQEYIDQHSAEIDPLVNSVVGRLDANYDVYIVSNNPQEVLEPFADRVFGVDVEEENVYGTAVSTDENGRYEKHLDRNMLQREGKETAMYDIGQKSALDKDSLAVGDSVADIGLFKHVDNIHIIDDNRGNTREIREELGWELRGQDDIDAYRHNIHTHETLRGFLKYLRNGPDAPADQHVQEEIV